MSNNHVALGVCGGIAAYKAAEILRGLQRAGCTVKVAMTRSACEFIQPLTFRALSGSHVIVDDYAPENPDPIAHINFSQTIDLLVIAPATANIIGKFANGIADDFLTSTYLACTAPILVAPAMNTTMWEHPANQRNLKRLSDDGVHIIQPDAGEMACGTIGPGRLSDPDRIVSAALDIMRGSATTDLSSERILITVGATREEIDPVRFITNHSSGKMGFALAEAARRRGAEVIAVTGATTVAPPKDIKIVRVSSAKDMANAVSSELHGATAFIGAAAVADYTPIKRVDQKIKKDSLSLSLELERTPDILSMVSASREKGLLVIGFAAETENIVENAGSKLRSKKLDAIVANDVSRADAGFDADTNIVTILVRGRSDAIELPIMSKLETANRILDLILQLRANDGSSKSSAATTSSD